MAGVCGEKKGTVKARSHGVLWQRNEVVVVILVQALAKMSYQRQQEFIILCSGEGLTTFNTNIGVKR